eukprot:9935555-Prorocentrum_lima.AAC.1
MVGCNNLSKAFSQSRKSKYTGSRVASPASSARRTQYSASAVPRAVRKPNCVLLRYGSKSEMRTRRMMA